MDSMGFSVDLRIIMFPGDNSDDLIYDPKQAPLLHQVFPAIRHPSLARRTDFLQANNDCEIKEGKFKSYEDNQIILNYENFLNFYKIKDSTATRCALFGFNLEDPEEEETVALIKKLIKPCGFYYRLATNLPKRLISSVFARARKLFNPFRAQKEIDSDTKEAIIQYAKSLRKCDRMYAHIANQFNIDPLAARRIIRRITDLEDDAEYRSGKWSRKENIRLLDAICKNLQIDPNTITRKIILEAPINWPQVSRDVRTRCPDRCREHAIVVLITNLPAMILAVNKRRIKKS